MADKLKIRLAVIEPCDDIFEDLDEDMERKRWICTHC